MTSEGGLEWKAEQEAYPD